MNAENKYHPYNYIFEKFDNGRGNFTQQEVQRFREMDYQYRVAVFGISYKELLFAANDIYQCIGEKIIENLRNNPISAETGTNIPVVTIFEEELNQFDLTQIKIIRRIRSKKYDFELLTQILEQIDKEKGEY